MQRAAASGRPAGGRSAAAGAQRRPRIDVDLPADELTVDMCLFASVAYEIEPFARRTGNRHQDDVGARLEDDPSHLVRGAQDGRAEQALPPEPRIVVDEADKLFAGCLAKLTCETPAAPACAHDEDAPARAGSAQFRDASIRGA